MKNKQYIIEVINKTTEIIVQMIGGCAAVSLFVVGNGIMMAHDFLVDLVDKNNEQ